MRRMSWRAGLGLLALAAGAAHGGVLNESFFCGSTVGGTIQVNTDDAVQVRGGPFQSETDPNFWTISAGIQIDAAATPVFARPEKLAWMQAVTAYSGTATFRDRNNNDLAAVWPDTTPGGYFANNVLGEGEYGSQPFDQLPWYGNNTVGQLDLFDSPRTGTRPRAVTNFNFETWLVCVVNDSPANYSVIPLIGFTWGYQFQNNGDGPDAGTFAGDSTSEYSGTSTLGPAIFGGTNGAAPSAGFTQSFQNYWSISFLENNDTNCRDCIIPAPGALALAGAMGIVAGRRRRR